MVCISEKLSNIKHWLDFQHYDLTVGLKSIRDAEKLYDYWQDEKNNLPELCDYQAQNEWDSEVMSEDKDAKSLVWHMRQAIGYNPFYEANKQKQDKENG